jgi:hypothetical protein
MSKEIKPRKNTTMKEILRKSWLDLKRLGIGLAGIGATAFTVALQFLMFSFTFVAMLAYQIYHIIWPY